MTWIDFSYKPPSKHEKYEIWASLKDETRKAHSLKELQFPNYNAQNTLANWKKIEKGFPWNQYRLIYGEHNIVYFINVESFTEIYRKHQKLFEIVLGGNTTLQEILDSVGDENSQIWTRLKSSHLLCGILLGFGIENAKGFEQSLNNPNDSSSSYLSVEKGNWAIYSDKPKVTDLPLPAFRVFTDGEDTLHHYREQRERIISQYHHVDFYKKVADVLLENNQR